MKKFITLFAVSIENLNNLKYPTSFEEKLVLYIIYSKCKNEDEKLSREEESIDILKILSSTENI